MIENSSHIDFSKLPEIFRLDNLDLNCSKKKRCCKKFKKTVHCKKCPKK